MNIFEITIKTVGKSKIPYRDQHGNIMMPINEVVVAVDGGGCHSPQMMAGLLEMLLSASKDLRILTPIDMRTHHDVTPKP